LGHLRRYVTFLGEHTWIAQTAHFTIGRLAGWAIQNIFLCSGSVTPYPQSDMMLGDISNIFHHTAKNPCLYESKTKKSKNNKTKIKKQSNIDRAKYTPVQKFFTTSQLKK
jgi:hypothetical protein